MTKTDFFRVVIKIFGIYCFIQALFQLLPNISFSGSFASFSFTFNLIYLIVMGIITFLLLFRTDRLIKLFRLEKGFDTPTIDTKNLSSDGLFKFGIIIIGLLMISNNISSFVNYCYLAFKKQVSANGLDEVSGSILNQYLDYNWWIISGLNVLIGVILLVNYKRISKLLVKNEEKVG
ncbi:hypothetical protein [Flagellimonas sp. 2504JD4-2]